MAGIETVIGTQIPIDAATIADMVAGRELQRRGQDIQLSIANADNATRLQTATISAQAQLQATMIDAAEKARATQAQFYVDMQRVGVEQARLNFDQRMGAVNAQLQHSAQVLQAQGARVDARFRALQMLADRSGPQDWVAYNYLLNNMAAPTGKLVDPTAFANEIKDPAAPDIGGLNQPYSGAGGGALPDVGGPVGGGFTMGSFNAGGGGAPVATAPPAPLPGGGNGANDGGTVYTKENPNIQTGITGGSRPYVGIPNEQVAGLGSGQWALVTTGTGGNFNVSDLMPGLELYTGQNGSKYTGMVPGGTPVWVKRLAQGGYSRDPMAIVGDAPGPHMGPNAEMVANPTRAPIRVLSHEELRDLMHRGRARVGRDRVHFQVPRAAAGLPTLIGGAPGPTVGGGPPMIILTGEDRLRSMEAGGKPGGPPVLIGGAPGPTTSGGPATGGGFTGFGRGPRDVAAPAPAPAARVGMNGPRPVRAARSLALPGTPQAQAMANYGDAIVANAQGGTAESILPPTATPGAAPSPVAGVPGASTVGAGVPLGGLREPSGPTVLNPDGSYGGNFDTSMGFRTYDPATLGSQPFWMKLLGLADAPDFQQFGATLSNPALGIYNAPANLNLQNYMQLTPSERDQVDSLYRQGLRVDFRDMLEAARRAYAPMLGTTRGVAGYGA